MTGYRNPPQTAPSSTGVTTCGLPCIGRPAAITPITLEGENNVLFVRCEALRDLARDGSLGLPQASIDVVTDVLSDLREYGGVDDISCRGVRWPLATGDSRPWLVIEGSVESLRRLFALKWFMGSRHIYNLTVIPWLQGHVIALLLASGDPHTVYDLVVDTRPHVIEVDKGGIVKAISYLYPTGTSLEELERLGKALTAKLANVFDLDVMKVEIRDVTAQFFQPNLGPLHVYDEPDRRTHAAPIKSRNLIVTRAYFSNHPAESSTSPSPLLPASSTDPSLSRKRRLDDVEGAEESAPLPKRPKLTGDMLRDRAAKCAKAAEIFREAAEKKEKVELWQKQMEKLAEEAEQMEKLAEEADGLYEEGEELVEAAKRSGDVTE